MSDWYYLANNEQNGPITESTLRDFFSGNKLPPDTLVWKDGMEGWANANQMPIFSPSPELISADSQPPVETTSVSETLSSSAFPIVLAQKNFLRGQQTFELLNDHILRFQIGKGKKRTEGQVYLANLNPTPQRIRKWHIGSLILAVPMIVLSLILLVAGVAALFSATSASDLFTVFIVDAFSIVFTALLVGNVYVKRQNSIVFTSVSGAPLTLWFENPDKRTFEEFLGSTTKAVE